MGLTVAGGDEGGHPDLWVPHVTVQVDVRNDGDVAGKAVPQLYLSYPKTTRTRVEGGRGGIESDVDFPVRVLRGFEKVDLEPGMSKMVEFSLTRRDLSYWDVEKQNWVMVVEGAYKLAAGWSSRDLPLSGEY